MNLLTANYKNVKKIYNIDLHCDPVSLSLPLHCMLNIICGREWQHSPLCKHVSTNWDSVARRRDTLVNAPLCHKFNELNMTDNAKHKFYSPGFYVRQ